MSSYTEKKNEKTHSEERTQQIQQTGAPIRGKTWASIPKVTVVESTRELIGASAACKITALDVIKADREKLIGLFHRLTGKLGNINPFLFEMNAEMEDGSGHPLLPADCSRLQAEESLQQIMKDQCNVVVACLRLLNIMSDSMVTKAKRVFADSLESGENSIWFSWNKFVGVDLDSMSEAQQVLAEKVMEKWWELMTKIYNRLAGIVLDSGISPDTTIDVEVGLKEWRNHANLVKGSTDFEEVFLKERLVFNDYGLGKISGMGWDKRKDALNKLLERKELGLDSILDFKRVDLATADNYETWMKAAIVIFKLAESKGIKMVLPEYSRRSPTKFRKILFPWIRSQEIR